MSYAATLHQKGYIETLQQNEIRPAKTGKSTDEDFAARITAEFLPYLDRNIPDGKFILLQCRLRELLREHSSNSQKEKKP